MLYNEKKKEMKKMKMILGLVVAAGVVAGGISYKNAHSLWVLPLMQILPWHSVRRNAISVLAR